MKKILVFLLFVCVGLYDAMSQIEMQLDTVIHTEKGYYIALFSASGDDGDLVFYLHERQSLSLMKINYGDDVYPRVGDKSYHSSTFPLLLSAPTLPTPPSIDTLNSKVVIVDPHTDPRDVLIIIDDTSHFMDDTVVHIPPNWTTLWVVNTVTGQRQLLSRPRYYDTVYIHDTIYIQEGEGIDNITQLNAKIYQRNRQIVVEGAEGYTVCLYDVVGRLLATRRETAQEVLLDVPASGAYLVKIGDAPARRIVVRR